MLVFQNSLNLRLNKLFLYLHILKFMSELNPQGECEKCTMLNRKKRIKERKKKTIRAAQTLSGKHCHQIARRFWARIEFACSPCICVGLLWVLWFPPAAQRQVRRIGNSKLPLGVNVFVSPYVCYSSERLVTCSEWTQPLSQCLLGQTPSSYSGQNKQFRDILTNKKQTEEQK